MGKDTATDIDDEPLEDKTQALPLRSRRLERLRKKHEKKQYKSLEPKHFLDLPQELLLDIITLLRPSDIFVFSRTSKSIRNFILEQEVVISKRIIDFRYAVLSKCFRLPKLLRDVDPNLHPALRSPERQEILAIHKKPYQHIQAPDPSLICTCMTCLLRWSALNLCVDFAHWQDNLDSGTPIPIILRGKNPSWNRALIADNALFVSNALTSQLWYTRILECHLDSTVRSIRRHAANKGNRRKRFRMTNDDVAKGTDAFLERSGPPSLDFPFHRDNYYMLEAYLPNRGRNGEEMRWLYVPESQHDMDVQFVVRWMRRNAEEKRAREEKRKEDEGEEFMTSKDSDAAPQHALVPASY